MNEIRFIPVMHTSVIKCFFRFLKVELPAGIEIGARGAWQEARKLSLTSVLRAPPRRVSLDSAPHVARSVTGNAQRCALEREKRNNVRRAARCSGIRNWNEREESRRAEESFRQQPAIGSAAVCSREQAANSFRRRPHFAKKS